MHETLCVSCGNACNGGCSWSKSLTPVDGWKAEINSTGPRVIECPEFIEDKGLPADFDTDAMLLLAEAVGLQINDDYVHGTPSIRKTIEKDLRSYELQKLLQLSDPGNVITQLRAIAKEHDEAIERKLTP